ncbi:C6 zinc finger domain-containing protein [Purpureocillium lavendulum]|uniref:C6 zinc finger domain-containing protein n=1 Tax=Purpureocillium lavendulum TaxID=1247861 RepID=A0AB34G2J2_9HYPO|nr:C6 zinc finger domain-containing protein [Purpureocillium lavendulum]
MKEPVDSGASLTQYDKMILRMDKEIKPFYFGLASFFSWLLLAGFLTSPTTYSSVRYIDAPDQTGDIGKSVMHAIRNIPLIFIASFACIIAAGGLAWLWIRWRHNRIWINRYLVMFVPP